jgi:hypothetical protein
MIEGLFLIPMYAMTRKGKVTIPLDYSAVRKKIDRRTRFYRFNAKWKVSAFIAVNAAERFGLRVFREDGVLTRILAPDAKSARAFFEYMQKNFDFGID